MTPPRKFRGVLPASQVARMSAAELRAAHAAGWRPPMAGGDPALADPLQERLKKVDGTLGDLRQEAGEKWRKLDEAKEAVGKVNGDITPETPEFKALDQAGKDYGEIADKIADAEAVKATLIDNLVRAGVTVPDVPKRDTGPERDTEGRKSAGDRVVESDEYKELKASGLLSSRGQLGAKRLGEGWTRDETKALLTGASPTSAGAFVQPDRQGYYPLPQRPLTVLDLITIGDTDSDLVEYVRMTSFTNAAAEVAEATAVANGQKPEAAMAFEVVQEGVSTIAHWVPATKRALADAGQLRTIIDGMLRWGLDDRVERQIVAGDGVGDNLLGILNQPINAVPAGARSNADKMHFGITAIRLDNIEPTGMLMEPLDWEEIRLSRTEEGGADTGDYLFGPPSAMGAQTLWGKPVAVSASIAQGTGLVGAFAAAILWMREGTQVLASDSHLDFFTKNLVAVLAELRAGFGVPMPQSFAEVNFAAV